MNSRLCDDATEQSKMSLGEHNLVRVANVLRRQGQAIDKIKQCLPLMTRRIPEPSPSVRGRKR